MPESQVVSKKRRIKLNGGNTLVKVTKTTHPTIAAALIGGLACS